MDWSLCPDVESVPGKVSGAWVVKGTRVPADALISKARDGHSAEELVQHIFPSVSLESAQRILVFAEIHQPGPT